MASPRVETVKDHLLASAPFLVSVRLESSPRHLCSRFDPELPEHLTEAVFDGPSADEELRGGLAVRDFLRHKAGDVFLLRRQLIEGVDGSPPSMFASRFSFDACALGERRQAEVGEEFVRDAQVRARVHASPLTSQPLPIEEMRAREIDGHPSSTEPLDCLDVTLLGSPIVRR
jgi:hypothetical protein